jgi:RNA polymerase sigma factor (sigma-70 family)
MSDETVAKLVERCRKGDSQAEEKLFERHLQSLMVLVRGRISRKLKSRFDPEDVVQSAYRSFFGGLGKGQFSIAGEADLWRLLAAITLHKLHRKVARELAKKRTPQKEQRLGDGGSLAGLPPDVAAKAPTPSEAAALIEELELVMSSLDSLQRRMLELRLQGHTVEEIASETNRSERTVRRLLDKLKTDLEQRLQESQGC